MSSNDSKLTTEQVEKISNRIFCIVFLAFFIWAMSLRVNYLQERKDAVQVDAVVSNVKRVVDNEDNDYDYNVYVKYNTGGRMFSSVYWKTTGNSKYDIGEKVKIEVNPKNPAEILDDFKVGVMFLVPIALLMTCIAGCYKKIRGGKKDDNINLVTGKKLVYTLASKKPAMTKLFVGVGFLSIYYITDTYFWVSWLAFAILFVGLKEFFKMIVYVLQIPKKKVRSRLCCCIKKWEKTKEYGDKIETTSYVEFDGIDVTEHDFNVYDQVEEGRYYYVIQTDEEKICEAYDSSKWRVSFSDESIASAHKFVIVEKFAEMLVGCALSVGSVAAFEFVANLLAK